MKIKTYAKGGFSMNDKLFVERKVDSELVGSIVAPIDYISKLASESIKKSISEGNALIERH